MSLLSKIKRLFQREPQPLFIGKVAQIYIGDRFIDWTDPEARKAVHEGRLDEYLAQKDSPSPPPE